MIHKHPLLVIKELGYSRRAEENIKKLITKKKLRVGKEKEDRSI